MNYHHAYGARLSALWALRKWKKGSKRAKKLLWLRIGLMVSWSSPWIWVEDVVSHILSKQIIVRQPVFIIGYPRSGTTWLHNYLILNKQIAYCNTAQAIFPNMFLTASWFLYPLLRKNMPQKRAMDNVEMGSEMPAEEEFALQSFVGNTMVAGFYFPDKMEEVFDENVYHLKHREQWKRGLKQFCKKLLIADKTKTLLLKSPFNMCRVKEILEVFPDARFIHIQRNPLDVFVSNQNLYKKILPQLAINEYKEVNWDDYIMQTYIKCNERFNQTKHLLNDQNYCTISYQELKDNFESNIEKVHDFLGMDKNAFDAQKQSEFLAQNKSYLNNQLILPNQLKEKISKAWNL